MDILCYLARRTHRAGFAFARLKLYRARILPQPPVSGLIRAALELISCQPNVKNSGQPELPIEGTIEAAPVKTKSAGANGNGADHVIAETVEAIVHKPFDPKQSGGGLHTRVDRGFLDYASYVIRDRAIPNLADGLKPVQRRILHVLHTLDDGRFIKVASVTGETMKYHPHGNASIDDAIVVLANKRYLIEGQGNFGNI